MKKDILTSSFLDLRARLHHIAMKLLHSDEDAEDALQDTYLKLRNKGDVETSSEAGNKLVAVLRNVCIDRLREKRTIPLDTTDIPETLISETETEDLRNLERLLQSGLTHLQKKIFNLVTHEGMEYEEINRHLQRLHRDDKKQHPLSLRLPPCLLLFRRHKGEQRPSRHQRTRIRTKLLIPRHHTPRSSKERVIRG